MENPKRVRKLNCTIERDLYTPGRNYVVTAGGITLDVTVVTQRHKANLKQWMRRVRKIYNPKNLKKCKIVVAINAINSQNFRGGRCPKDLYYQLLQICIGEHCLLIDIEPYLVVDRSLRVFFQDLVADRRFLFVGVGIKHIMAKLYKDYKDTDFKGMCNIRNPVDLMELAAIKRFHLMDGRKKCNLKILVKLILSAEYEKPVTMNWYGERWEFSEELIMWSSVDVYLMARITVEL